MKKLIFILILSSTMIQPLFSMDNIIRPDKSLGYFYPKKSINGVMGNGHITATAYPGNFTFHYKKPVNKIKMGIDTDGKIEWFDNSISDSYFLPGIISYAFETDSLKINVVHSIAHNKDAYVVLLMCENKTAKPKDVKWILDMEINEAKIENNKILTEGFVISFGKNRFTSPTTFAVKNLNLRVPLEIQPKSKDYLYMIIGKNEHVSEVEKLDVPGFIKQIYNYYTNDGIILNSPDPAINKTVNFAKFHLHMGYNWPETMICDMFRWRDVWSRDLGSGFGPGAINAGMFDAAYNSLKYELKRHSNHNPKGLKVSVDASQGGSAEGLGWVMDLAYKYYMLSNDKNFLRECRDVLKPWVDEWIKRDYDRDGLIIDVTEWMDHSRFFRLPYGIKTLYSNVLFYVMLDRFSKFSSILDMNEEALKYKNLSLITKKSINEKFLNEKGFFNNYVFYNNSDEKLDSISNSLLYLYGLAPNPSVENILSTIKNTTWRNYGSANIYPPMKIVGKANDQNVKCWPWWEAKESKLRFLSSDVEGGMKVLKWCTDTLDYVEYPGLMEEYLDPDTGKVESFAGHAFITGAGSVLNTITEGLIGFEILEPGSKKIRIAPNTPYTWKNWQAVLPVYDGKIQYIRKPLEIEVHLETKDSKIIQLKVPEGLKVTEAYFNENKSEIPKYIKTGRGFVIEFEASTGTRKARFLFSEGIISEFSKESSEEIEDFKPAAKAGIKSNTIKNTAVFYDVELGNVSGKDADVLVKALKKHKAGSKTIKTKDLIDISSSDIDTLFVPNNILPIESKDGKSIKNALDKYLNLGKTIVFWGPECSAVNKMGEESGIIHWKHFSPKIEKAPVKGPWKIKLSDNNSGKPFNEDKGYLSGYYNVDVDDSDWKTIETNDFAESKLGSVDGYIWYRKKITFERNWKGREITLNLGKIDDMDWIYVNGHLAGNGSDWQSLRSYTLKPKSKAYESIKWGNENTIAIQVLDIGGGAGLHEGNVFLSSRDPLNRSWQYFDEINLKSTESEKPSGTVYWGKGGYFPGWSSSKGIFGIKESCSGIRMPNESFNNVNVNNIFTDFSVSSPWVFVPIAFTAKKAKMIESASDEMLPCYVKLKNTKSSAEIILIAPVLTKKPYMNTILEKYLIKKQGENDEK